MQDGSVRVRCKYMRRDCVLYPTVYLDVISMADNYLHTVNNVGIKIAFDLLYLILFLIYSI